MKKILFSLLIYAGFCTAALAQTDGAYTIKYNDPYDIKPFKISLLPMYGDLMLTNRSAGAGLHIQGTFGKIASVELLGRYAYTDRNYKFYSFDRLKSTNPISLSHSIELGGEFHLTDGTVNRELLVALDDDFSNKTAQTINIQARKILAIRAGYNYMANSIKATNNHPLITTANGDKNFGDGYSVMYNTHTIYIGATTKRIDRVGIIAGTKGERQKNRQRQLFVDLMYGAPSFQQLTDSTGSYDVSATPFSNFGARVGGQWINNRIYTRAELGLRPGMANRNYYFMIIGGFTIFGNEPRAKG